MHQTPWYHPNCKGSLVPCRFRRINAAQRPVYIRRKLRGGVEWTLPERLAAWRTFSLDSGLHISDPIIAICHNSHPAKRHSAPCVHLNYSIPEAFVNGFSTKTALYLKQGYGTQMRSARVISPFWMVTVVFPAFHP